MKIAQQERGKLAWGERETRKAVHTCCGVANIDDGETEIIVLVGSRGTLRIMVQKEISPFLGSAELPEKASSIHQVELLAGEGTISAVTILRHDNRPRVIVCGTTEGVILFGTAAGNVFLLAEPHRGVPVSAFLVDSETAATAMNPSLFRSVNQKAQCVVESVGILYSDGFLMQLSHEATAELFVSASQHGTLRPKLEDNDGAGRTLFRAAGATNVLLKGSKFYQLLETPNADVAASCVRLCINPLDVLLPNVRLDRAVITAGSSPALSGFVIRQSNISPTTAQVVGEVAARLTTAAIGFVSGLLSSRQKTKRGPATILPTPFPPSMRLFFTGEVAFSALEIDPTQHYSACYDSVNGRIHILDLASGIVWFVFKGCRSAQISWMLPVIEGKSVLVLVVYLGQRGVVEMYSIRSRERLGAVYVGKKCVLLKREISTYTTCCLWKDDGSITFLELTPEELPTLRKSYSCLRIPLDEEDALTLVQQALEECRHPAEMMGIALGLSLESTRTVLMSLYNLVSKQIRTSFSPGPNDPCVIDQRAAMEDLTAAQAVNFIELRANLVSIFEELVKPSQDFVPQIDNIKTQQTNVTALLRRSSSVLQPELLSLIQLLAERCECDLSAASTVAPQPPNLQQFVAHFWCGGYKIKFLGEESSHEALLPIAHAFFDHLGIIALSTHSRHFTSLGMATNIAAELFLHWAVAATHCNLLLRLDVDALLTFMRSIPAETVVKVARKVPIFPTARCETFHVVLLLLAKIDTLRSSVDIALCTATIESFLALTRVSEQLEAAALPSQVPPIGGLLPFGTESLPQRIAELARQRTLKIEEENSASEEERGANGKDIGDLITKIANFIPGGVPEELTLSFALEDLAAVAEGCFPKALTAIKKFHPESPFGQALVLAANLALCEALLQPLQRAVAAAEIMKSAVTHKLLGTQGDPMLATSRAAHLFVKQCKECCDHLGRIFAQYVIVGKSFSLESIESIAEKNISNDNRRPVCLLSPATRVALRKLCRMCLWGHYSAALVLITDVCAIVDLCVVLFKVGECGALAGKVEWNEMFADRAIGMFQGEMNTINEQVAESLLGLDTTAARRRFLHNFIKLGLHYDKSKMSVAQEVHEALSLRPDDAVFLEYYEHFIALNRHEEASSIFTLISSRALAGDSALRVIRRRLRTIQLHLEKEERSATENKTKQTRIGVALMEFVACFSPELQLWIARCEEESTGTSLEGEDQVVAASLGDKEQLKNLLSRTYDLACLAANEVSTSSQAIAKQLPPAVERLKRALT